MSNNFYNHGSFPTTGSAATSASMRAELDAIAAGFDKMPTLTGNANEIVVVNSSGTALTAIPTLPATSGGTGFASYAVGDLLYAATTTALAKLADVVTGNALISGGVGVAPSWGKIGLTTHVTGTLPATNGGTGQASYAVGDLLFASTTTALSKLADVATGNALISGGVGVAPSYGKIGLTTHVSGTLPTANGGTNLTSFTANGVVYASSTSALATGSALTFDGSTLATTGALTVDGNTTLGNASTDTVTVNGYMGVGGAASSIVGVYVRNSALTGGNQYGIFSSPTGTSAATTSISGITTAPATTAEVFTATSVYGLRAANATLGAGSTITNLHGVFISDQTQGTNNFGITSQVSSGTNKWNIYASGTAANYFAGDVLIGTNSAAAYSYSSGRIQLAGTTEASSVASLARFSANTGSPILNFAKSRGASVGTNTVVQSGDDLGLLAFVGADGTNYIEAARIRAQVDGTPGTNDMPGRLVFSTTADGASSPTERMRLDSAGNLGIGTSSPAAKLHLNQGFQVIDKGAFAATKFNSQGVAWNSVATIPSLVFNADAADRPEISWIRGANTYPEFSIRQHTTSNSGGQFWVGSGSAAPNLVATVTANAFLIGTGTSQSLSSGGVTGNLQIETANGSTNASMVRNTANATGPIFAFGKSRGAAFGSRTAVISNDVLGYIVFDGADGTNMVDAASIQAQVDGTPGTNDMPGRLLFSTTADGASTPTERMRIDSSGNINIATAGARITGDFSNATVANRVMFQSSTTNGNSFLSVLPNGTSVITGVDFYSSSSDPANSSIFRITQISTEASLRANISGTGSYLPMTFYTGGSERMRLNTSGYLGINTTAAASQFQVDSTTEWGIRLRFASNTITNRATFLIQRSLGSLSSPTAVTAGTIIGGLEAGAYNGTAFTSGYDGGAGIQYQADATWTALSNPSNMTFWTTPSGGIQYLERMRIDSNGSVGIGTSSPSYNFHVKNAGGNSYLATQYGTGTIGLITAGANVVDIKAFNGTNDVLTFTTGASERARINSIGNLLVGATTSPEAARLYSESNTATTAVPLVLHNTATGSTSYNVAVFYRNTASTGSISTTNNATAYNTSSDYRLKENIQPMTGALAKVAALKPCTYTWKDGGMAGEGFIAHELQAVCPDAVTGEKDAVNADGKPVYQGIDTSFLVATLTAAIKEQQAMIEELKADIAALKGA